MKRLALLLILSLNINSQSSAKSANNSNQADNQGPITQEQRFELAVQEQINFSLLASDPDGDDLQYSNITLPQYGQLTGNAPDYSYIPNPDFNGIDTLVYSASDGEFSSTATTITFSVGLNYCQIYPYALEQAQINTVNTGDQINQYSTSVGSGNYSLLTWTAANDSNTLAASFGMPGDSENYTNQDNGNDHNIDIADWLQGVPGKKNARHVRDALDLLIGETITLPLWSQTRGAGSNFDYQVGGFANIELTDYKLNGQSNISFIYHGTEKCLNYAPISFSNNFSVAANQSINIVLGEENDIINAEIHLKAVHDADADTLTYIIEQQPSNGILTGTGPEYNYTPNGVYVGDDSFSFKVNDGKKDSNISVIDITVINNNQPPVAQSQTISTPEDHSLNITLTGSDVDNDTLSYQIISQPNQGTLTGNAPNLTYTPAANYHGSDQFSFLVNDGSVDSAVANVSLTINPVNDTPIANSETLNTLEDESLVITLIATDVDNDPLSFQIIMAPAQGVLTGNIPNITYIPNSDFNGNDQFSYIANDGQQDSSIATINLNITAVNDTPVATAFAKSTAEDTSVAISLQGTDIDNDQLTYIIVSQPSHGSLLGNAPDLIYQPPTDYHGEDSFTYLVNDGHEDSATVQVGLSIQAVNDEPIAHDINNIVVEEDSSISIELTGFDQDGDQLSYQITTVVTNGTLTGQPPVLNYSPNSNFNGSDEFNFIVNDGSMDSSVATVSITINAVNDAPIANTETLDTPEDENLLITLMATDVDNDPLSFQITTAPTQGTLTGNAPNITYSPNSNFNGTDQFSYIATDTELDSQIATINLNITAVNDIPVATALNVTTAEDTQVNILLLATDIDNDTLTYTILTQPTNGVLTAITPNLIYTPNANYNGTDTFTYLANDGTENSQVATVSLTLTPINDAPIVNDLIVTTQYQTPIVISFSGTDVEDQQLSFQIQNQPQNGIITEELGVFSYQPDSGFSGLDSFSYTATDTEGFASELALVNITVAENDNLPPVITSTPPESASVGVDSNYQVIAQDPEMDVLEYSLKHSPANASIDSTTGLLNWMPQAEDSIGLDTENLSCKIQNDLTTENDHAELIFLVDSSGSMHESLSYIPLWVPLIDGQLNALGVGNVEPNRYGFATFGYNQTTYISMDSGELLGEVNELANRLIPWNQPSLGIPGASTENMISALVETLDTYALAEPAAKAVIFMTDEDCDFCTEAITASTLQRLQQNNIILHGLVDIKGFPFEIFCGDGTIAMGMDVNKIGYVADGNNDFYTCEAAYFTTGLPHILDYENMRKNYTETAFATGGSIWDIDFIASLSNKQNALTKAVSQVVAQSLSKKTSLTNLSDNYFSSINYNQELQQLSVEVSNRGLSLAQQTSLTLNNSSGVISIAIINELQPTNSQMIVFNQVSNNLSDLSLEIATQSQQECTTQNNTVKLNSFAITVSDEELQDQQYFTLSVNEQNTAPIITSVPSGTINAGVRFQYNFSAEDNNKGDRLTYELTQGRHLAQINPYTGLFIWQPKADTISPTSFTVMVTDLAGLIDTVDFQLATTQALIVPKITSLPIRNTQANSHYSYQLEVAASASSFLVYDLLASPENMSIDSITGLISWEVATFNQGDVFTVTARVKDHFNNADTQSYLLAIDEDLLISPATIAFNPPLKRMESLDYKTTVYFRDANAIDFFQSRLDRHPAGMFIEATTLGFPNIYTDYIIRLSWPNITSPILEKTYFTNHWCGSPEPWTNLSMTKQQTQFLGVENNTKFQPNILYAALNDSDNNGLINSHDDQALIYANDEGIVAHSIIDNAQIWFNDQVIPTNGRFSEVSNNALTIADINADLIREILVIGDDRYITALTHDGQVLWKSTDQIEENAYRTAIITKDLDSDGQLEIIAANLVLNSNGTTRFIMSAPSAGELNARRAYEANVLDINDDGLFEVIYFNKIYNHQGQIVFDGLDKSNYHIPLNIDADESSEWLSVNIGSKRVILYDDNASEIWRTQLAIRPIRPIVADIDHDGSLDILFQDTLLNIDGGIIYQNANTSIRKIMLTDLNNDGAYELLRQYDASFQLVDPITRESIAKWDIPGSHKQLILAQIDNQTKLLLPYSNTGNMLIDIIGSTDGQFDSGINEWKQAHYHNTFFDENTSMSMTTYQTYSQNSKLNTLTPDFHVTGPAILLDDNEQYFISTELSNLSPSFFSGDLVVKFFDGDDQIQNLIGETIITDMLANETKKVKLVTTINLNQFPSNRLVATVSPILPINECKIENNIASSEIIHWAVIDSFNLETEFAYGLRVQELNLNPRNPTTPPHATVLEHYNHQLISENKPVTEDVYFHLAKAPDGLRLSSTGEINWIPTQEQTGTHQLEAFIQDESGRGFRTFIRIIVDASSNLLPIITSSPVLAATATQVYSYQVQAHDPEGTALSYGLINSANIATSLATISTTGLLQWTPQFTDVGDQQITLRVTDADGFYTEQSFIITVDGINLQPVLESTPSNYGGVGRDYSYQIVVTDDGILNYSIVNGPTGMTVDNNGLLTWMPDQIGMYPVAISINDGQYFIQQSWEITVINAGSELAGTIAIPADVISVDSDFTIGILPTGIVGQILVDATLDGNPLTLDEFLQTPANFSELGSHTIVANIADDHDNITVSRSFEIVPASEIDPPQIAILSPADGNIATGLVDMQIRVQDSNIATWQLSYQKANNNRNANNGINGVIIQGTTNVNDAVVGQWDTSMLRNGIYNLILQATDEAGQSSNISISVFLEGDFKIGHFQIAFEDLSIPVAGIPVTISRSYDTRDRNSDRAFGKGWSIGYQSLQLSENRIPGLGWFQQVEYFVPQGLSIVFPRYCIKPIGDRLVSIRLPDGTLEKFKVKAQTANPTSQAKSNCQDFIPPDLFVLQFEPQGDTNSALSSTDTAGGLRVTNGNLQTIIGTQPIDPNKYTLTLLDGTKYQIDQGFDLTGIETIDGNTITFTENGIEHNNGYAVQYLRDAQGRIEFIEKANGDRIAYTYDSNGDLQSHTDFMGNTTTFTYLLDHYLEDIIDPRGIMVARNEYDADGRLIAHVDANGNRIEYTHDIQGRTETIKDCNGNSSIYIYDDAGNVIAQSNALGETTLYEYNDIYLETKRTDPLGNET
ncbi:MAG: tandem-95 repeat protein, partial [Alcanivoracaceae bacterium]|nr:tandem-95 repeat protein [Alcanivoracaceae bacterium]